jgi:hypothetical protein
MPPANFWDPIDTINQTSLTLSLPWHFLVEVVDPYGFLSIEAFGEWDCLGAAIKPCGPNGHASFMLPDPRLLLTSSPPGALIGKFGGSSAGHETPSTIFAIGSRCVVAMPEKRPVPLYIAVNGAVVDSSPVLENFRITISGAPALVGAH